MADPVQIDQVRASFGIEQDIGWFEVAMRKAGCMHPAKHIGQCANEACRGRLLSKEAGQAACSPRSLQAFTRRMQ